MKGRRVVSIVIAIVLSFLVCTETIAATSDYPLTDAAGRLHELGFFNGVGTLSDGSPDYALEQTPSIVEAICLFVKLIGKEAKALEAKNGASYTGVPEWASPYVSFVFTNGYISGDIKSFRGDASIKAPEFLFMILNALGYSSVRDFDRNAPFVLTDKLGITDGTYNSASPFHRRDMATVSVSALESKLKGTETTLCDWLVGAGVITRSTAEAAGFYKAVTIADATPPNASFPAPVASAPSPKPGTIEMELFMLINAQREKQGLNKLEWDPDVAAIALAHSVDMSKRDFFSHNSPEGLCAVDRFRAAKLSFRYIGETLAKGYTTADAVMKAWMASPAHKSALMSDNATHIGIGVYEVLYTVNLRG